MAHSGPNAAGRAGRGENGRHPDRGVREAGARRAARIFSRPCSMPGPSARTASKLPVTLSNNNRAAAKKADVIFLCVKPQTVGQVVDEIRGELNDKKLVISIAASVPTDYIERRLRGKVPVIRAMPNTPSVVGAGITAIATGKFAGQKTWKRRENFSTRWAGPWSWTKNTWTR